MISRFSSSLASSARGAVLIGAQALDHRLAGVELCAQRLRARWTRRFALPLASRSGGKLLRLLLDSPLGLLHLASELFDLAILELGIGLETVDDLCVAAQRAHELFLAVELRAHALELEILARGLPCAASTLPRPRPSASRSVALDRRPASCRVCRLAVVAPLRPSSSARRVRASRRAPEHERQLGAPVCEQPGQTIADVLNRRWSVGHDVNVRRNSALPCRFRRPITVNHVTTARRDAGVCADAARCGGGLRGAARLAEALLQRRERLGAGAQRFVGHLAQRRRGRAVDAVQVGLTLVDVEQPSHDLAVALMRAQVLDRVAAVADVVVLVDLAQQRSGCRRAARSAARRLRRRPP